MTFYYYKDYPILSPIRRQLNEVSNSLSYMVRYKSKAPSITYMYPDNNEKEISYQKGMKAGLMFRYNDMLGYRALK